MSLNLVSPRVKVREVDLTIGNISGAQDNWSERLLLSI